MNKLSIIALSFLSLLSVSHAFAASTEVVKAAVDAATKAGLTDIESLAQTGVYRCPNCYAFEIKGTNANGEEVKLYAHTSGNPVSASATAQP